MKDIHISGHRIRTELLSLLVCFVVANALNVYAIIHYQTSAWELLTSQLYVLMVTAILYAAWSIVRILIKAIKK